MPGSLLPQAHVTPFLIGQREALLDQRDGVLHAATVMLCLTIIWPNPEGIKTRNICFSSRRGRATALILECARAAAAPLGHHRAFQRSLVGHRLRTNQFFKGIGIQCVES